VIPCGTRTDGGAGVLLSARLSFILAVAAVAMNLGIIGEAMQSAIVLIVIATCSTAPVIFNWLVPSHQAVDQRLSK